MTQISWLGGCVLVLAALSGTVGCGHSCRVSSVEDADHVSSGDSLPAIVIDEATKFVAAHMGARFCHDNVRFDREQSQVHPRLPGFPVDFAEMHPEFASQPCYRVVFEMSVRESPWAQAQIELFVDGRGHLLPDIPVVGVPDCVSQPGECQFPIDRQRAVEVARQSGLEEGLRPWEASFGWGRGSFVWRVSNTLFVSPAEDRGRTVVIDANSGELLRELGWGEGRVLNGP